MVLEAVNDTDLFQNSCNSATIGTVKMTAAQYNFYAYVFKKIRAGL